MAYKFASFQTTYEELKRLVIEGMERAVASFQTTYEELKPASDDGIPTSRDASRLPMRN